MGCSPMGKIVRRMNVRDCSEMPVRFCPPVLGGIALLAYGTANECLADPVVPSHLRQCQHVGKDGYFDSVDIERHGANRRLSVVGLPEIKFVGQSLEHLNNVDRSLGIVPHQRATGWIIPPAFKLHGCLSRNAVHIGTISQAFCDSPFRMLVLDDEGPIGSRIFCLPENPHLPYRRRSNEIICKLRRRKSGVGPRSWRSSHG